RTLQNSQPLSDVTVRYTIPDAERLREAMQTVESTILSTYPLLYNMLIATSPEYPPMPMWEPAALKWPKPRAGIEVRGLDTITVDDEDDTDTSDEDEEA
ncbi:integrase, partial [Burkholderia cenocepacia]|nr:integrase [Burkholderia cenocepacia]